MKPKLINALSQIAPNISIEVIWEHDPDLTDIRQDCDGMDDENPDDWQAWQSEVRASIISEGEIVSGSAYLGGTWERAGDSPWKSNPEISGYLPQMVKEALRELPDDTPNRGTALDFVADYMRQEYERVMGAR